MCCLFSCLFYFNFLYFLYLTDPLPSEKVTRIRSREKPSTFSYHKWAHLGVPMLLSAGDDTKLFAYSAKEFTKFAPHDICPAPQRVPIQLVRNSAIDGASVILFQYPSSLDILPVQLKRDLASGISRTATTRLLARVKTKASRTIICSTISSSGLLFGYSDHVRPSLFELRHGIGKSGWLVHKRQLPHKLPYSHCMIFSVDSSRLMVAGHDRKIYVSSSIPLALITVFCLDFCQSGGLKLKHSLSSRVMFGHSLNDGEICQKKKTDFQSYLFSS